MRSLVHSLANFRDTQCFLSHAEDSRIDKVIILRLPPAATRLLTAMPQC